eukprot:TRINITY_DN2260_c0_g1_i2.p1 TRINITY_DN2260_c0_g1~~TRINITY_DN2260_c0_g1_i2.p1  ORF type:complete len:256 (-),score=64.12 TRINITY_DN2260_c0_g1_i2:148-915(-)
MADTTDQTVHESESPSVESSSQSQPQTQTESQPQQPAPTDLKRSPSYQGSSSVASNKYKLVFVGDQSVGKTSLITRFAYNRFDTNYQATVGIDFVSKTVYVDSKGIRLQLWDTAGQERFHSLIPSYIRDSSASIIVYDVTQRITFDHVPTWVENVRNIRGTEALIFLVGNKVDASEKRAVSNDEGERLASRLGVFWMETSAKEDLNVAQLFKKIASNLVTQEAIHPPTEAKKAEAKAVVDLGATQNAEQQSSCSC